MRVCEHDVISIVVSLTGIGLSNVGTCRFFWECVKREGSLQVKGVLGEAHVFEKCIKYSCVASTFHGMRTYQGRVQY